MEVPDRIETMTNVEGVPKARRTLAIHADWRIRECGWSAWEWEEDDEVQALAKAHGLLRELDAMSTLARNGFFRKWRW